MENNLNLTKEKSEALELHNRILINANMACASWVETCKCLKQMRDTKLYIELGYEHFEAYTTQALGIKERQAYNYISTYENLGEQFLQSNATVGITKLALLAAVPVTERQELVENNDLAGMTVKEVEQLVKDNDQKGEQINMLSDELNTVKQTSAEKDDRIRELENEIEELGAELEEEKSKPTEVAVREPSEAEIEKIRQEILKQAESDKNEALKQQKKELSEKSKKDIDSAVSAATAKSDARIEEYSKQVRELKAAKAEADIKAKEFEKKLAVSASPESVKFTFYFEALQADYNKLIDSLKKIKSETPETAEKYIAAMVKFKAIVDNRIKEI